MLAEPPTRKTDCPLVKAGHHPIESKRYVITTPQIEALCTHIALLIEDRTPGGVVYARPRTGKTRSLMILQMEIATRFPGLPAIFLPAWTYNHPKERAFLEDLLMGAGHALVKQGTPEDKRARLVELMAQLATASGHAAIVLFVDEAQNLHEKHYNWLIGIQNRLELHSVDLITILVGQHQLVHQRTAFLRGDMENIVGRFMVSMFEFRGLTTEEDVRKTLCEYDAVEFPVGSGWSFTKYFLPDAFGRGWTLASLSGPIWRAFVAANQLAADAPNRKDNKKDSQRLRDCGSGGIPMQYFCRTTEYLLKRLGKYDLKDDTAVETLVTQAVASSGYFKALVIK